MISTTHKQNVTWFPCDLDKIKFTYGEKNVLSFVNTKRQTPLFSSLDNYRNLFVAFINVGTSDSWFILLLNVIFIKTNILLLFLAKWDWKPKSMLIFSVCTCILSFYFFKPWVLQWCSAVPLLVIQCLCASFFAFLLFSSSFPPHTPNLPTILPHSLSLIFVPLSSPQGDFPSFTDTAAVPRFCSERPESG